MKDLLLIFCRKRNPGETTLEEMKSGELSRSRKSPSLENVRPAKPTGVLKALLKTGELTLSRKRPSLEKVLPVKPRGFRNALLKNGERNCAARSASVETLTLLNPWALSSRISAGVVRPKLLALMKNLLLTS